MEFVRSVFVFKIYGKEYRVNKPTVSQVRSFSREIKDKDPEEQDKMTTKFLADLGLPESESLEMEAEHLTALIEKVFGQKKS